MVGNLGAGGNGVDRVPGRLAQEAPREDVHGTVEGRREQRLLPLARGAVEQCGGRDISLADDCRAVIVRDPYVFCIRACLPRYRPCGPSPLRATIAEAVATGLAEAVSGSIGASWC